MNWGGGFLGTLGIHRFVRGLGRLGIRDNVAKLTNWLTSLAMDRDSHAAFDATV